MYRSGRMKSSVYVRPSLLLAPETFSTGCFLTCCRCSRTFERRQKRPVSIAKTPFRPTQSFAIHGWFEKYARPSLLSLPETISIVCFTTCMGDCLRTGKLSWYITNTKVLLFICYPTVCGLPPLQSRWIEYVPVLLSLSWVPTVWSHMAGDAP